MLDKRIPYKELIMKWEGNRQCPMPVCRKYGWECRWGLHGQPWSYEAVNLYIKAVFFLCKSETFGRHQNQFNEGLPILKQYLKVDPKWYR